jgi:hypothetical protein
MKQLPKNWLIWLVGILFVMSVMPSNGTKANDQQAIITSEYICSSDDDCPRCIGGYADITGILEENLTFYEELAFGVCDTSKNRCRLSEYCLVWDCPKSAALETDKECVTAADCKEGETCPSGKCVAQCQSVRRTLLDNTIGKVRQNPKIFLFIGLGLIAYFML